jgi:hypothetical protein
MKTCAWWKIWLGLLLTAWLLPAGCAGTGAGLEGYNYEPPLSHPIPPSYYGNSPMYEYWFTPPYWMPDADP